METHSLREQLIEIANKLFIYTDEQDWEKLQSEVFAEKVHLDMSSLGGPVQEMTAMEICAMWKSGFEGIDGVNHLSGNFLVSINKKQAEVFCYATATHFKESAQKGKTREFVGTYRLGMRKVEKGWRINRFVYTLKYMNGNLILD